MNAKAEQKTRTHGVILESAARLLRERGIAGARVADVMSGAGLTVGGFYAHFESKEALVRDTLRRTAAEMRERLFHRLDEKPPDSRAVVVVKRYLSALHRDQPAPGCPLPAVAGEIGTTAPEYGEVLAEQVEAMTEGLRDQLRGPSRRQVALALVALMYGGLTLARAVSGTPLSDELLKACRSAGELMTRA